MGSFEFLVRRHLAAVIFMGLFCGFLVGSHPLALASESASFQLRSRVGTAESSSSTSYQICYRFSSFGVQGESSSFQVMPSLNCQLPFQDDGGGRRRRICGDGILEDFEMCDDGNLIDGDGCSMSCLLETSVPGGGGGGVGALCGNAVLEVQEQCDDGNVQSGDGCSAACALEFSPPVEPPEVPLETPVCGNGLREVGERCDDGNLSNGDGCSNVCLREAVVVPVEEPSTPDLDQDEEVPSSPDPDLFIPGPISTPDISVDSFFPADLIRPPVLRPSAQLCGNGFLQPPEQCDDGNRLEGDGCDDQCRLEGAVQVTRVESGDGLQYITNDLTTLFFEQFPGGSGDYTISLRDQFQSYELRVIDADVGYFSFELQEEIPDGLYEVVVVDNQVAGLTRSYFLEVRQEQVISLPIELLLSDRALEGEADYQLTIEDDQPVLRGKTYLEARVAIYSHALDKVFIVFPDENYEFFFQYPKKLVLGESDVLSIVVHYENGHVSRDQEVRFVYQPLRGSAPVIDPFIVPLSGVFFFFIVALLAGMLSGVWRWALSRLSDSRKQSKKTRSFWLGGKISIAFFLVFFLMIWFLSQAFAATTTPSILPYEGVLKSAGGSPLATPHDFRFSIWLDADFDAGVDRDGVGAIPGLAPGYSGYVELRTITPDTTGFFQVQIGEVTPIPDFIITQHLYLQVEIKSAGAPDTAYETLDIDGIDNANDRQPFGTIPYARNSDFIDNAELGLSQGNIVQLEAGDVFPIAVIPGGTNAEIFELDNDGSGGVIQLSFGDVLQNQILSFDPNGVALADGWFSFSDDVNINGNLTITGTVNGVSLGPANTTIQYQPEYPNVIYESVGVGGHKGKMEVVYEDVDGPGAPDNFSYYKWTTTQVSLQNKDLVVRFRLPDGFVSWQATPITLTYRTEDGLIANNKVDLSVEDSTGTVIGTLTGNTDLASVAFTTANIGFGGGGVFTAGTEITLFIKLSALSGGAAYVSDLNFHFVEN